MDYTNMMYTVMGIINNVHNNVKEIRPDFFSNISELNSIRLNDCAVYSNSFSNTGLETVTANNVVFAGTNVFRNCGNIVNISLSNCKLSNDMFIGSSNVKEINISNCPTIKPNFITDINGANIRISDVSVISNNVFTYSDYCIVYLQNVPSSQYTMGDCSRWGLGSNSYIAQVIN